MNIDLELPAEELSDVPFLAQHNDLIRGRSLPADGECRLLWGVLENAIKAYLGNIAPSNPAERRRFQEAQMWFDAGLENRTEALFDYRMICELLGIDPDQLFRGLKSFGLAHLQHHRDEMVRNGSSRSLTA